MVRYEKKAAQLIKDVFERGLCQSPATLYHTFEDNLPQGMRYGDPQRNILSPLNQAPRGWIPPDRDYASSYKSVYCPLVQIPFLVDQKGQIHVTVGVHPNLFRATRRILEDYH